MSTVVNNDNLSDHQRKDIESRVEKIRTLLSKSTEAWLGVSREIVSAKTELTPFAFARFSLDAGLTPSVATKLVKIGRCKQLHLEANLDVLASIDGWTLLYDLSKLDEKKLQEVLESLRADRSKPITRSRISEFVTGEPSSKLIVFATIEINEEKLEKLNEEKFNQVQKAVDELKRQIDVIDAGIIFHERKNRLVEIEGKAAANTAALVVHSNAA